MTRRLPFLSETPRPASVPEGAEDFDLTVPEGYREAFGLRMKQFGSAISFFAPSVKSYETDEFSNCGMCSFAPVSITGPRCSLNCDHCQAKILEAMPAADSPEKLWKAALARRERNVGGLLVSGGSDKNNVVPLTRFFPTLRRIREELGMRIICHVGFADEAMAVGLAEAGVDQVLLDIIGSDETIRDVYHLPQASTKNYRSTLAALSGAGLKLSPHVVIGLHYGSLKGELAALDLISEFPISSLVLVALQPTPGTPMAHAVPPTPEEMGEIFVGARLRFPETPILLGCERPLGEHKIRTDELAVKAGLNGIAYPAEGIIALSEALGLRPNRSAFCCAIGIRSDVVSEPDFRGHPALQGVSA